MQSVDVTEPALLIRIARRYNDRMSPEALYEVTRGVWRIGQKREVVQLALAVADGVVQEVFVVRQWHPAASTAYKTRPFEDVSVEGRWEFTGEVAQPAIRDKYVGQSVAHYFPRGHPTR